MAGRRIAFSRSHFLDHGGDAPDRRRFAVAIAWPIPQTRRPGSGCAIPAGKPYLHGMMRYLPFALALYSSTAGAASQAVMAGRWDVTSTVVDAIVPGAPGFLVRMMRGKSKAEHKRLPAGQGVEALLAPDPKAQCRIESQQVSEGKYAQRLSCPQKRGDAMQIVRTGTYDAQGFAGRATVSGATPKGRLAIVLDQRAHRIGD